LTAITTPASLTRPGLRLPTGFAQHPVADRIDQPGFFGNVNEAIRHDQAQFRMQPADQRLDTNDQAVFQADQRLVMENEFPSGPAPDAGCSPSAIDRASGIHFAGIELEGIAADLLGLVHRRIGVAEQGFQIQPSCG
jgi:hypothetical protein